MAGPRGPPKARRLTNATPPLQIPPRTRLDERAPPPGRPNNNNNPLANNTNTLDARTGRRRDLHTRAAPSAGRLTILVEARGRLAGGEARWAPALPPGLDYQVFYPSHVFEGPARRRRLARPTAGGGKSVSKLLEAASYRARGA